MGVEFLEPVVPHVVAVFLAWRAAASGGAHLTVFRDVRCTGKQWRLPPYQSPPGAGARSGYTLRGNAGPAQDASLR